MSHTLQPQVFFKSPECSLEASLQQAIDDLNNSESIDIEEGLELAKAGTDHWVSHDSSEIKVLMFKKNKKKKNTHSLFPSHPSVLN